MSRAPIPVGIQQVARINPYYVEGFLDQDSVKPAVLVGRDRTLPGFTISELSIQGDETIRLRGLREIDGMAPERIAGKLEAVERSLPDISESFQKPLQIAVAAMDRRKF
jgi:hypothetical protein